MTLQTFIEIVAKNGDITAEQAAQVVETYRKLRLFKTNPYSGVVIRHGAILDRGVIRRALMEA